MAKQSKTAKTSSTSKKSPMDSAGMIIRTSSGRTFGKVTTFSGQRETQEVFDRFLTGAMSPHRKLGS